MKFWTTQHKIEIANSAGGNPNCIGYSVIVLIQELLFLLSLFQVLYIKTVLY